MSLTQQTPRTEATMRSKQEIFLLDNLALWLPSEFSLAEIAEKCGKHKDTIRKYLQSNFREGEDYTYTPNGGKIIVARDTALHIGEHYDR